MSSLESNRRLGLVFGIGAALLQGGRVLLWGRWPNQPLEWFVDVDGYLAGGLMIWAALLAARNVTAGRAMLGGAWGFFCGILYRSFFEQVANPARHGGHEWLVMTVKGALLAVAAWGFFGAVRSGSAEAS